MKRLSKVVNIVPVIAKADTLTLEERDYFKQRVRKGPGVLVGAPQLPLPLSPGSFGKPSAWLGARRIPRAAALSDPMWQEGRPSLQTLPCVSLGPLSARSKFGARGLGACFSCLLCCCFCCFRAGLGYSGRPMVLHTQPRKPSLCHILRPYGNQVKTGGFAELSQARFMGKQAMKFPRSRWWGAEEGRLSPPKVCARFPPCAPGAAGSRRCRVGARRGAAHTAL